MRTVSRERVENALHEAGVDPDRAVRDDYSGRFMYGETCFGLVFESTADYTAFVRAYVRYYDEVDDEDDPDAMGGNSDDGSWLDNARTDSMGLSGIWYWPGVKLD